MSMCTIERESLVQCSFSFPTNFSVVVFSLQMEWLISDELVSLAREAFPVSVALLQNVVSHVQASHGRGSQGPVVTCLSQFVPLHFVFGPNHSMDYFITVSVCQCGHNIHQYLSV